MTNIVWQHELKTTPGQRPRGTKLALDAIRGLARADPTKARVLTYIGHLVANGYAQWAMLDDGDIELRFNTGETFLLAKKGITRLS